MFEVNTLVNMYRDVLQLDGIPYICHSSRFSDRVKAEVPNVEKRIIKNKSMICFSSDVDDILKEEISPSTFIKAMIKIINPIRDDMSLIKNSFAGSFPENCQQKSVPVRLLSFTSLLVDGCSPPIETVSQSVMSISRLVVREFRKRSTSNSKTTARLHNRVRETPVPIYAGLKLYATVRSKTIIDKLSKL